MKRGIWLGFFFFIALVLLGFGTLLVGNIDVLKKPHYYQISFDNVSGLKKGDGVRVEGVAFGKVKEIGLDPRGGVAVTVDLDRPLNLYEGYEIWVEAFTVLGGNFISIKRGDPRKRELDTTEVLSGRARPSAFDEFGRIAQENRKALNEFITNMRDITAGIKQGKGSLGKFFTDPAVFENFTKTLEQSQKTLQSFEKTTTILQTDLKEGKGPFAALLRDEEMTKNVKKTMASVEKIAGSVERLLASLDKGEGVAGSLLRDKELQARFKRTVENIEATTEKLRSLTKNAEGSTVGKLLQEDGLYKKGEKLLDDADSLIGRAARSHVFLHTEAKQYAESDLSIYKLGIRIEPDDTKYFWGGVAIFELDKDGPRVAFKKQIEKDKDDTLFKFDAGLAYRIPWFLDKRITLRAGLIEGKFGGAIEFLWEEWGLFQHPVLFVAEARQAYDDVDDDDIDERSGGLMARAWVKTALWGRNPEKWWQKILHATKIYAGVSRIGHDVEFFGGVGLEWEDRDIRSLISLIGLGS